MKKYVIAFIASVLLAMVTPVKAEEPSQYWRAIIQEARFRQRLAEADAYKPTESGHCAYLHYGENYSCNARVPESQIPKILHMLNQDTRYAHEQERMRAIDANEKAEALTRALQHK